MSSHFQTPIYTKLDLKDSNGLRRRNGPRQPAPKSEILPLNKSHLKLLQFVHLFGGYSTSQLIFEYAKLEGLTKQTSDTYIRDKLLKEAMFHNHGVIDKPSEQWNVRNPYGHTRMSHSHFMVYQVSEHGDQVLKEAGMWNEYAPKAHGWYKHQLMTATMYQMLYLSARKAGIKFVPQHELKPKEKYIALPPKVKVFPDAVFMLETYKPLLFFFELDRGTEKGKRSARKTWGKSIEYYKEILLKKRYLSNLDLPDNHVAFLATVTTDATMADRILAQIEKEFPKGSAQILVHTTRAFGPLATDFASPRYFDALDILWKRVNYPAVRFNRST